MQIDYISKPEKSLDELLTMFNNDIFLIIEDVLSSLKTYRYIYQQLLDIMKLAFENVEIRTYPIRFKFKKSSKKYYTLQIRHFISNLILWRAFIDMDRTDILDESYIFDFTSFNIGDIVTYINNKILPIHEGDFASKNKTIDEIFYNITAISNAFCLLMGMGISIYDIIQLEKRNPEMSTILYGHIDPNLQPVEIEHELQNRTARLMDIIIHDTDNNDLKPLLVSGKNLSDGQFKEIFVKIGLKADINGNTIPLLIDTNLLVDGLNKPSYIYINAISGRKALVQSKMEMGTPGALSKKLNHMATSASYLRKDYEKCDSTAYIEYTIHDQMYLNMLHGRYYYKDNDELGCINKHADFNLIGSTLKFRSPCTCNSKEGICRYCYGDLFYINYDMFSVGALAATKLSNPLGQSILSSKHQQITSSNLISFNNDFDKAFELLSDEITIKDDAELDDNMFLMIDELHRDESDDQEYYYVKSFKIINPSGEIVYNITEENDANLYLSDSLLSLYKRNKDKNNMISLETFDSDSSVLFNVEIKNKELTEPVKIVQKILNSNDKLGATTLSEVCQIFVDKLLVIGIKYDFTHAECIIRGLLRKQSNEYEFPEWGPNDDHEDYQIMRLNAALFKNPSALISMSYGDLRRQLISPELYQKTAASHIDPLFVSKLSEWI